MTAITDQRFTLASNPDRKSAEIDQLLRGSILRGPSSMNLGWDGFVIERHTVPEAERPERSSDHHFIILDVHSCHGERADPHGRFIPYSRRSGSICLSNPGTIPVIRNFTKMELIVGALSPALVNWVDDGLDGRHPFEPIHTTKDFQDGPLRTLMSLLITESDAGGPCGRLYADSLVHALATRVVQLARAIEPAPEESKSALPGHLLRRVLERMHSEFSRDLSLAALAAESGYSRAHFLRMFQAATGQTPHRYLLSLRLENAARMMKDRSAPLIEIALACGFSSHTHFTKAFRSKFGVLPSQYRRGF